MRTEAAVVGNSRLRGGLVGQGFGLGLGRHLHLRGALAVHRAGACPVALVAAELHIKKQQKKHSNKNKQER